MKTYAEKLKDPRWTCRRADIIEKNGGLCQQCGQGVGEVGPSLQIHHVAYIRSREPWDYPDELLICLCPTCHTNRQVHDEEARFEFARLIGRLSSWEVYSLSKKIREHLDAGWKPKLFDAFEAIKKGDHA